MSWRCGRAARRATRTRSTSSRPTICARSASRTMPGAARTSATPCRPAARDWIATIPRVALLMEQQKRMMLSMGQMLGEEVLHVMRASGSRSRRPMRRCAARRRRFAAPAASAPTTGAPATGHLRRCGDRSRSGSALLRIGDVYIGGVERRGLQRHRAAPEARVAVQAHDDGDADQRHRRRPATSRATRRSATTCSGARLAAQAGLRRSGIVNGLLELTRGI